MIDISRNQQALFDLPRPKAIIFDWDNTLADTWPLIQIAIDRTMVAMGKEAWGLKKVRDNIHKSMRESFPHIFGDEWEKAGRIYKNSYREIHLDKIQLLDGALDLINKISKSNILQCVVSNKMGVTLRKEASQIDVESKFFSLIGSLDSAMDKPNKAPVELALLGSGLDPKKDEIWFIGDTISDLECAYNSGCRPIIYGCNKEISKTISDQDLQDRDGKIPVVYFDHGELVKSLGL